MPTPKTDTTIAHALAHESPTLLEVEAADRLAELIEATYNERPSTASPLSVVRAIAACAGPRPTSSAELRSRIPEPEPTSPEEWRARARARIDELQDLDDQQRSIGVRNATRRSVLVIAEALLAGLDGDPIEVAEQLLGRLVSERLEVVFHSSYEGL